MAYKSCTKCRKAFTPTMIECSECGGPLQIMGKSKPAAIDSEPRLEPDGFWRASRYRFNPVNTLDEKVPYVRSQG